jgi:hypothetical protein
MPIAINKCPDCGEPVTPFAAGCAVCGSDIAAARRALAERRQRRARRTGGLSGVRFRLNDDALRIGFALILALGAPLFGLMVAGFFAWQVDNEGRTTVRNVLIAIAGFAAVSMAIGISLWGRFGAGY